LPCLASSAACNCSRRTRVADAGDFGARGGGFAFDALQLAGRRGGGARVVFELRQAFAFGEAGLLRFAPELDFQGTRLAQGDILLAMDVQRLFEALAYAGQALALLPAFVLGTLATGLFGFFLALEFRQVAVDLRRAFLETGLRLGQLEGVDLRRVESLLRFLHGAPRGAELALAVGEVLFRRALYFARRILGGGTAGEQSGQFVDLALALDHAVGLGIRYVERQAAGRQHMAGTRHALSRRQRQFGCEVVGDGDAGQPLVEHAGPARVVTAHLAAQAVRRCRRCRRVSGQRQRQNCRRRVNYRRTQAVDVGDQRREAFAQHRLDRGFPAGLDLDRLPQRLGIGEIARLEPVADLAALRHLGLQLRQRVVAGTGFGQAAMRRLQRFARRAQLRLGRGYGRLQRRQLFLGHGQRGLGALFAFLRCRQQRRIRRTEGQPVLLQPAATLHQVFQCTQRMALVGLGQAQACSASLKLRRASVTSPPAD
jgi:hypothetical protein